MTEQPVTTAACKYPGCQNPPEPASGPGRRPQYCADPGHNAMTAYRERKRLADPEHGTTTSNAGTDQPVTMARITGAELLRQMRKLAGTLAGTADRLTGAVATMADPTAAEAEVEAARAAAEQRAATAEAGRADAERRAAIADQMRADADDAVEDMSTRLAAGPNGPARPTTGSPKPPPRTPPRSSSSPAGPAGHRRRPDRTRHRGPGR